MFVWDEDGSVERKMRQKRIERHRREAAEIEAMNRQRRIAAGYPADPVPPKKPQYDSPYAMEDSTATFLYVAAMIIGTLFQQRILVYITATVIWWKYITRHEER